MKSSKATRDRLRKTDISPERAAELTSESQFQRAELRRIESRCRQSIERAEINVTLLKDRIDGLKALRVRLSQELQRDIFDNYIVLDHRGEGRSMTAIFKDYNNTLPPAGSGECAAPKLLHYAFRYNLQPVAMGEFWWGRSPRGEMRRHGEYYPACKSKCEPILSYMLQGMELERSGWDYSPTREVRVLYEDKWLAVVDKPAGLLSVKGRVELPSVESLLPTLFPNSGYAKVVHRLDMDTSGILLIALDAYCYSDLQRQFAQRSLTKEYLAILDGVVDACEGEVDLALSPDHDSRPRQMVDMDHGKEARTQYRVLSCDDVQTRIALFPHTGRTHQLRLHCAHPDGLGVPIVGDRLYGHPSQRLMLQALKIAFAHPVTLETMSFEVSPEF